ncbi:MAG: hypothetical protein IPO83_11545 [Chitinophagaceae bacterium]|nr:hypothetical protein [Chitinophagaceae bacterium]
MNTVCNGATFSFQIDRGKVSELEALLLQMKADPSGNAVFPMGKLKYVHYASWVLVPEEKMPNGKLLPIHLLLLTTYWGNRKAHIRELSELSLPGLRQIMSCCEGYVENGNIEKYLYQFLKRHCVVNSTYNAFQYATVEDIKNEEALRKEIENFLDQESVNSSFLQQSAKNIRDQIQQHVKAKPEFSWATTAWKRGFANNWALNGNWILLQLFFLLLLLTSLFGLFHHNLFSSIAFWLLLSMLIGFGLMLILFRLNELKLAIQVKNNVTHASDEENKKIADQECERVCNEMTVTGPLKAGFIRPVILYVLLAFARIRRANIFIPTVHTARWLQLDGGRRIVFIAYFDNTSDGYARDFVDSARRTKKVNLILGHGNGYPYTRWALFEGGKDANGYMNTVRKQQKLTNVWYATHKELSILNVLNNQLIRRGLWGEMKEEEVKQWLQYF